MESAARRIQNVVRAFGSGPRSALALWICLFLVTRLYTLYFGLEYAWTSEEYFRGTIAREFLGFFHGEGLRLPLWEYQADSYLGGTLVVGLITAINYSLFGVSLLSLKLTAVYFALATLIVTYRWLRKESGPDAANVFALFYVLASPGFISLGLISMGYHTESVLFFACSLALGSRIRRRPGDRRAHLLFGIVSGLGFWFSYINGITTAAVVLALASSPEFREQLRIRMIPVFLGGLLIGLIPWFYFNWNFHFAGWNALTKDFLVPEHKIDYSGRGVLYLKARKVLVLLAREVASFQKFSVLAVSYLFLGALFLAASGFDRARNHFLTAVFTAYALLFLAAFTISNRFIYANEDIVSHRYLMNFFYLLAILLSLQRRFGARRFQASAGAIVLLSLFGLYEHFDIYTPIHRYSPESLAQLGDKLQAENFPRAELPSYLRLARTYPESRQPYFLAGLDSFDNDNLSRLSDPGVRDALASLEGPGRNFLLRRMGSIYSDSGLEAAPESELPGAADRKEFLRGYFQSAVAQARVIAYPGKDEWFSFVRGYWQVPNDCHRRPVGADPWFLRGVGAGMRGCGPSVHTAFREIASVQEPVILPYLAWGIGWQLRKNYLQDPLRGYLQIRSLPESIRADALEGASYFEKYFGIPASDSIARLSENTGVLP